MADVVGSASRRRSRWLRKYPPLATFVAALLIMLVIMPSALNLPQANPSTVLEYAPIPPEDQDEPPPQEGSLSSLGLGTSSSITTEGLLKDVPEPDAPAGEGGERVGLRCVDLPDDGRGPIQTEDPNSPPCQSFFQGDNGGATYQGVTGEEIRVILYSEGGLILLFGDQGGETTPTSGSYCDLNKPSDADDDQIAACFNGEGTREHPEVTVARALNTYFNSRYQLYNRKVHMYVYWSTGGSPSARRSDAQDNWERIKPFAVIDNGNFFGNNEAYAGAMSKRNVTVFGNYSMLRNATYRQFEPFMWSFWPDIEHAAEVYFNNICQRVAGFPVSRSGNTQDIGQPRKYGLLYTTDVVATGQRAFAALLKDKIQRGCPNGQPLPLAAHDYTYPNNGFALDTDTAQITAAGNNIAQMQADDVTTILWLSGYETRHSEAADDADWYPEWVVAGDLQNDQLEENQYSDSQRLGQNQNAWRYAWTVTPQLRETRNADRPCRTAFREAFPDGTDQQESQSCTTYRGFFMAFRSFQVAGPELTPEAVNRGNHAVPRQESISPFVGACFFDPGDYSCVKDANESWWDPDAPDPRENAGETGCWRMVNGGRRHLADTWPREDATRLMKPDDPCTQPGDNGVNIN